MKSRSLAALWRAYWFAPAPYLDLAVVRVFAVGIQLFSLWYFDMLGSLTERAALPDDNWAPLPILNIINLPFGWGFRPPFEWLTSLHDIAVGAGILALVGLATNLSLVVFSFACLYLEAYEYSFNEFHHVEAITMIALSALAISPSGRVLSIDALIRRLRGGERLSPLTASSPFAGWPIKLLQWFFVLMYLSAVTMKFRAGGLDWANGFTLQYYLIQDGLRWNTLLGLWLAQHHWLIVMTQIGVELFQATFALAVLFPWMRFIYVPAGLTLHTGIYLALKAPFFSWLALYSVFIPWSAALRLLTRKYARAPLADAPGQPARATAEPSSLAFDAGSGRRI
jgi:hypothetical protein